MSNTHEPLLKGSYPRLQCSGTRLLISRDRILHFKEATPLSPGAVFDTFNRLVHDYRYGGDFFRQSVLSPALTPVLGLAKVSQNLSATLRKSTYSIAVP